MIDSFFHKWFLLLRFASLFTMDMTDNDLVTIVRYGNETFACSETNNIWKIDTETLESLEKVCGSLYFQINKFVFLNKYVCICCLKHM